MRKITCIIFLMILTSSAFSQQFLWSTTRDTAFQSVRYVPVENVLNEVLKFYEQYEFYFDGSGYSKDGFFKTFEKSQSFKSSNNTKWAKLKKKISAINDLTVFAFKDNLGDGSIISILCITKDNVDMLSFSNNYASGAIMTHQTEKEKFISWFSSFIPNQVLTTEKADQTELQDQDDDKVFTKVEYEAEFPGGNAAWSRYIAKSLDGFDASQNGASPGKYQVIVRFIVGKDGSISDVTAETNFGYGMEEKAIKIIQKGPNWKPALQNGRNVKAYRRQPIAFTVN